MYLSSTTAFQKRLGRTGGEDELWDQMIFSFIEKVPHPTWWDEWCLISFRMHPDPNLTCRPILWSKSRMVFSVPVSFSIYGWCASLHLYTDQNLCQVWKLSQLLLSYEGLVSFWDSVLWFYYSSLEPQKALVFIFSGFFLLLPQEQRSLLLLLLLLLLLSRFSRVQLCATHRRQPTFRSLYILIWNRNLFVIITSGHNHE